MILSPPHDGYDYEPVGAAEPMPPEWVLRGQALQAASRVLAATIKSGLSLNGNTGERNIDAETLIIADGFLVWLKGEAVGYR